MRFAYYARVSTEELQDKNLSFAFQRRKCEERIQDLGHIVREYGDVASGASRERPGLQALLRDACSKEPPFDAVVVYKCDRLARDQSVYHGIINPVLRAKGILIYASDQSADPRDDSSILLRDLLAVLAEDERRRIVKRSTDAMKENAMLGNHNGGTCPYGYMFEEFEHSNPSKRRAGLTKKRLIIDPETAPIVRDIFKNYCFDNMGLREIRDDLNRRGVPSPGEGAWARSSIRAMLYNPKYTGYQVWGRQRRVKEFINPLVPSAGEIRKKVWNPPEEWTFSKESTHEAIIPKEWFVKVSKVAKDRASSRVSYNWDKRRDKKRDYLFRGMIRCGICGRRLQPSFNNGKNYYRCHYRVDYGVVGAAGNHPNTVYLREDKLESAIDNWLLERIFSKDRLMYLKEDFAKLNEGKTTEHEERIKSIQSKIKRIEEKIGRQLEAIEKGVDPVLVGGRIEELKQEKKELRQSLKEEMSKVPTLENRLDLEKVLEKIPDLSDKLRNASKEKKRKLLEAFRLKAEYEKETGIIKLQVELSSALSQLDKYVVQKQTALAAPMQAEFSVLSVCRILRTY